MGRKVQDVRVFNPGAPSMRSSITVCLAEDYGCMSVYIKQRACIAVREVEHDFSHGYSSLLLTTEGIGDAASQVYRGIVDQETGSFSI